MCKLGRVVFGAALTLLFAPRVMPAADLSNYRGFSFGTDLPAVAKQIGVSPSAAKTIHSRPALIQDLAWRPRSLDVPARPESVSEVVFSFYNGELYQIAVSYDRYEIEGMTAEDITEALSSIYGPASRPAPAKSSRDLYGDQEDWSRAGRIRSTDSTSSVFLMAAASSWLAP